MATISKVVTDVKANGERATQVVWALLTKTTDDVGEAVEMPGSTHRSFQVTGTFGAGGTIVLQGSNDGTNYVTLKDILGNAVSFTAAGIKQVHEITRFIRPAVTAGDGTTSLTVTGLLRRDF